MRRRKREGRHACCSCVFAWPWYCTPPVAMAAAAFPSALLRSCPDCCIWAAASQVVAVMCGMAKSQAPGAARSNKHSLITTISLRSSFQKLEQSHTPEMVLPQTRCSKTFSQQGGNEKCGGSTKVQGALSGGAALEVKSKQVGRFIALVSIS